MACKHGNKSCGVYWTCGPCEAEESHRAWLRLTPAQREYDRMVTSPGYGADEDRAPESCSCHINPPCSYCTREVDESTSTGGGE